MSGVWRRIKSLLGGRQAGQNGAPSWSPPSVPRGTGLTEGEPALRYRPVPLHQEPAPRAVTDLAESLSVRLTEDETLRNSLTDEEFQLLLDWALERIRLVSETLAGQPPVQAEMRFKGAQQQLIGLLRSANLAVGQRAEASPALVLSRLQLIDTAVEAPLFEARQAAEARARLGRLLAERPETLKTLDGVELVRRIVAALG